MLNSKIVAIEYYLPTRVVTNSELCDPLGVASSFIEEKLGIRERHFAGESETSASMGVLAGKKLLGNSSIDPSFIDMLVAVTQSPDYVLPGIAPLLQQGLGLPTGISAFDVNLACSGYAYALAIAASQLNAGLASKALIITSECYSRRVNLKDKTVCTLFGDAASATLLEIGDGENGFLAFDFGTDGRGFDKLIVPAGGMKNPVSDTTGIEVQYGPGIARSQNDLFMDGKEIYQFALDTVPSSVDKCLCKAGLKLDNVDFFIFHQANKYMVEAIARTMNLPSDKVVIDLEEYGNTVSSTIPIAFQNLIRSGRLKKGDTLLLCGFGVGLSWGTCIYKF